MKWIGFAVIVIALTVSLAAWWGQPTPLELKVPPSISEGGVREDLDFDRIQEYIRLLAEPPSRLTGYPGSEQALELIQTELGKIGLTDSETQEFLVPVPIVESAVLVGQGDEGMVSIPLHPLWPNLARTSQTAPEGLSGTLVDVGTGSDADLSGKDLTERIALVDWNSRAEWLNVPEFGGKAVIFRASDRGDGYTAREKFLTIPADFPRFYVTPEYFPVLDRLHSAGVEVTLHCQMEWKNVTAKNLLVRVSGARDNSKNNNSDAASMIFHAYYDSISVVPGLSPGAEQACSAATLLELAHYFRNKEFDRPIYLLFTGAHGQALAGMTHFVRTLKDGLKSNWSGVDHASLIVRMGKPCFFAGLDLSSRSERFGAFCVGRFRGQREDRLRPKFSTLGLKLDEYAKSFREIPDVTDTLTPFVDCINLTLGRGWSTYFPYQAPFESELPNLSALPGITFSTINDDRRYVDTPDDTMSRMRLDLLRRQIIAREGEHVGLANLALALASWSGPFTNGDLSDVWSRLSGRVVWLNQQKDYTPNEPLISATVFLKTQRGDKYLMGTRGIPCAMTDDNGAFHFDGLVNTTQNWDFNNCTVEPYGTATADFISQNPTAYEEMMKVRARGGKDDTPIPLDGSIIYALDMARAKEYPWQCSIIKPQHDLNLVCFPCRAFSLVGLTDPRGYIVLKDLVILEAGTQSPPFEFGQSATDFFWGSFEESCVTLWADPTIRVRLLLGLGFQGKRLILVDNTLDDPIGKGFVLEDLDTIPSMVLQGARDMWNLNESRLQKLEFNGVKNPRIKQIHLEAKESLDAAGQALASHDYRSYRSASERGWSLESKAYGEILAAINNMIRGVLFYLALLMPFSYCLERILFASNTIRKRITLMGVIFISSFTVLALVHPAFRFTMTPLIVLLAFVILALAGTVSALIVTKMDGILQERKQASIGVHEDTQNIGNVAVRAVDLGVANIRRRPQRGILTGATIVLVTFILLSFTSLVPVLSIAKVKHPEGKTTYRGLLVRDRRWQPLPSPLRSSLERNYGVNPAEQLELPPDSTVAARAWFFSDYSGNLSQIDLSPARIESDSEQHPLDKRDSRTFFTAVALLCMEHTEPAITGVDKSLIAGRWFQHEDDIGVILPRHVLQMLGMTLQDIGREILVFGQSLPLIGVVDEKRFDAIEDIDGEPLTPVDFVLQSQIQAKQASAEEKTDMLQEYVHYPTDQIAIVPLKYGSRLGATYRSVAVRLSPEQDSELEARGFALRSNQTILACDEDKVTLFASLDSNKLTGTGHIIVPLLLGFLIVLSTMLGSVFERRNEIFIYNSVGLSPTNVSSLFLAESSVYAILGASAGYLLGQVIAKIFLMTGTLSGLSLNYSAGSAVFVTASTMVIVLLSTLYPARQAFLAAIPESDEETREDDTVGNSMSLFLPFVADPRAAMGIQAYLYEYLESVQGVTVGKLGIDNLSAQAAVKESVKLPVVRFRAWLSPFDLGVSHDAEIGLERRPDRGIHQFYLKATLFSGDQQNWHRLTPTFIQILRKQFLMWRILSDAAKEQYIGKGESLFR